MPSTSTRKSSFPKSQNHYNNAMRIQEKAFKPLVTGYTKNESKDRDKTIPIDINKNGRVWRY